MLRQPAILLSGQDEDAQRKADIYKMLYKVLQDGKPLPPDAVEEAEGDAEKDRDPQGANGLLKRGGRHEEECQAERWKESGEPGRSVPLRRSRRS